MNKLGGLGLFGLSRNALASPDPEYAKRWAVFNKAAETLLGDPNEYRIDAHGVVIRFSHYGDPFSPNGWQYDHHPVAKALGGADDISNLRPLNCYSNSMHGNALGRALRRA